MGLERGGSKKLLDQISHIHGHLFYGGVVEGLDVPQRALVIFCHHVNSHSLPAKTASSSNPENITDVYKNKTDNNQVCVHICRASQDGS